MDEPTEISKTRRKLEMHALQALGEALVALPEAQLKTFDLPEDLLAAIAEARSIRAHGGLRRQLQYIGKLMRGIDPEPIRARLAALEGNSRAATAELHRLERWRERLLDEPAALEELLALRRVADVQSLRATLRAAIAERAASKPPKHQRELFRRLREIFESPPDAEPR